MNEDCFYTEAFLVRQYEGLRTMHAKARIAWAEKILLPSFRLPSKKEKKLAENEKKFCNEWRAYPLPKGHFLSPWNKFYLDVNDTSLIFTHAGETIVSAAKKWEHGTGMWDELFLDMNASVSEKSMMEIFNDHGQPVVAMVDYITIEKDSLGRMPFMIIDEDLHGKPIAVKLYKNDISVPMEKDKWYTFRFACSAQPQQYK